MLTLPLRDVAQSWFRIPPLRDPLSMALPLPLASSQVHRVVRPPRLDHHVVALHPKEYPIILRQDIMYIIELYIIAARLPLTIIY